MILDNDLLSSIIKIGYNGAVRLISVITNNFKSLAKDKSGIRTNNRIIDFFITYRFSAKKGKIYQRRKLFGYFNDH